VILVYSVKSYCALKISEKKEEIHFEIFITKKERMLRLLKKFVMLFGHDVVSVRVAQNWFKRSQSEKFLCQRCTSL